MKHLMVDLETLSSTGNSVILSIGAVAFDPTTAQLGEEFKINVTGESCQNVGLHISASTVDWWFKQSEEARQGLRNPPPVELETALSAFSIWLEENMDNAYFVWGNGATFDNIILRNAYAAIGRKNPWSYTRDSCYRTMKNQFPTVKLEREGVHHDSLDDARYQAKHLCAIFASLRGESLPTKHISKLVDAGYKGPEWSAEEKWKQSNYRGEMNCPHGIGHGPHVHGCDGCCRREDYPLRKEI